MSEEVPGLPAPRLAAVLGDAYRRASVDGADVPQVVGLLEPVRAAGTESDPFAPWRRLDAAAGQAVGTTAAAVVAAARDDYIDALGAVVRATVENGDRAVWVRAFARTLAAFRSSLLLRLGETEPAGADGDELIALAREAAPHVATGQWDKVLPATLALIEDPAVRDLDRARLLVIAAEIAMYWEEDAATALGHLDRAERLAPDEPRVWDGYGSVRLREDDVDGAEPAYRRVVELDPVLENGYSGLGLCAVARDDLPVAEAEYLRGVKECPDGAEVRLSLLRLYGKPSMFAEHEKRLPRLAEEIVAIDPQSDYDVQVSLGNVYRDNARIDQARSHYDQAIALRPTRSLAYEERGHLEVTAEELDAAERLFAEVVRLAPGRWNGPYGLSLVYQQRNRPADALTELRRCLPSPSPGIRTFFGSRIVETLLDLDRVDDAAAEVAAALAADPASADLRRVLRSTATRLWADRPADARALLDRFPAEGGPAAQAALVAEVASDAGDHAGAIESYREAVRLGPENADHFRSLAVELTAAREWDQARAAIAAAFRADQDAPERDRALATLENQRGHTLYESERFADAAEAYALAATLEPDEPVYRSNEALAEEARTEPGRRSETLGHAVAALEAAVSLSDDPDYAERLRRVRAKAAAVGRFGEAILTTGTVVPLRAAIAPDLVPGVDPRRDGSEFMYEHIPALRERVGQAVGVFIPGIRFREEALPPGGYQLEVYGTRVERGTVADGVTGLLERLEAALRRHAWQLLRTDELDRLITDAGVSDVPARTRLGIGMILRALLRDGIPLIDVPAIVRAIGDGKLIPEQMPAALDRARKAALSALSEPPLPLADPAATGTDRRPAGWTRPLSPAQENELSRTVIAADRHGAFVVEHHRAYRQRLVAAALPDRSALVLTPDEVPSP